MRRATILAACLATVGLTASAGTATAGLPDDCRVLLTLADASWAYGAPGERGDVTLYLDRSGGDWARVLTADARYQSVATHDGYVVESASGVDGEALLVRVRFRRDKWNDLVSEAAWRLRFTVEGDRCKGRWEGLMHGRRAEGELTGAVRPVRAVEGFAPPAKGEHPRLLVRKSQIPALRERAETEWGRSLLAELQADRGSPVAQAMAYVLTGDRTHADAARSLIEEAIQKQQWHHIGVAHAPAFTAVEHLIAYDLIHDACDPPFHERLHALLSDKLNFFYWGTYNGQFNNKRTSNWSLMYRSGLGLIALSLLDGPLEPDPSAVGAELPRLSPPKDLATGKDVPVVRLDPDKPIGEWLFAGPVEEEAGDDAFQDLGGAAAARPEAGTTLGGCTFRRLAEPELADGIVDLAGLTRRTYLRGCYLYGVLDVPEAGYYQLEGPRSFKGIRHRTAYVAGRRVALGEVVHLAPGRYPLLVRIWIEPVGNWEPLRFSLRLAPLSEEEALAWHAQRATGEADAFCGGASWREAAAKGVRWDLEALRWTALAAREAEGYFLEGLGDFGWNQEGEAYTRHAVRLAMPFALCYRNVFGRDIPGAERLGMTLALATATTVYSDDGASMQSFSVGGGPMDVDLFARGFPFVPEALRPAVLGAWNRSLALAGARKLKDPHGVIAGHDGLSKAMRLLTYPLDMAERNPGDVLPHVTVDRQKGGYVFRNRWKDGDDCVVQVFANSNQAGGSWASAQGGTFRITGLGHEWAVRGQGYGNGGSGRTLPDFCLYQNMVDVQEHFIGGTPQAWATHFQPSPDGSGTVSLDMDPIYIHQRKEPDGRGRWKSLGLKDLGIRAVRVVAVDYSGATGAPCLVAVADRLTGTKGHNTWQIATEGDYKVTVDGNTFTIAAGDGTSLVGTVVSPRKAAIRVEPYQHVHEINYHGRHARKPFNRQAVLAEGADTDQTFLVVMTLQRGDAPKVICDGRIASATIGKQTVRFDGEKIILEK